MQLAADEAPNVVLPIGTFGVSRFLDRKVWLDLGPYLSESGVTLEDFHEPAALAARAVFATLDLDVGTIPTASRNYDLGWALLRDFLTVPGTARALATKGYGAIPALASESAAFLDAVSGQFPGIDLQVFLDAIAFRTAETEQWLPAFIDHRPPHAAAVVRR